MDATTETLAAKVKINPESMKALGAALMTKFSQYEKDRRLAELKWARNARQVLGIYDPEIDKNIAPDRSRAYPKLTRVKAVSMLSRLMNLLFQTDDKCWGVKPSAVPNLEQEDLQKVLDTFSAQSTAGVSIGDEMIEEAIREFAKKRAIRLELEIEDQLQELGGNSATGFTQLCRKVLYSGILYGMGVLKGPFTEEQKQRTWRKDTDGKFVAVPADVYRPRFDFVPIWDYYPDMSAKYLHQMDGQFERHVMSKHQVIMLKQRPDFIASQIEEALLRNPTGNYTRKAFETELRTMGVQLGVADTGRNKFEAMSWEGYVSGRDLSAAGVDVPEEKQHEDLRANVWFMGDTVIKAELDPWSTLDTDGEMPMYHQFIFEEDESTLLGNGLPNIMRDSQMNLAAAVRMMIDNGSIMRVFELNTALLSLNQDIESITPDMIIYREDSSPATIGVPALRPVEIPMHVQELKGMIELFQGFADQETFVGPATGGDMQKGPSEPFRTAAGASMIRGDAALPFKDVVRNFDRFTESVIGAIIIFNRNFNANPEIQGDFKPIARGATSLIAKEVLGMQLDNFAATLTDGERPYVKMRGMVRARARVRDLVVEDIVVNDAEADRIDQNMAAQQQDNAAMQKKIQEAEVRAVLADTLKAITQAGKNTAAADATTVKAVLDALEKGLPIDTIIKSITTGEAARGADASRPAADQPAGPGVEGTMQTPGSEISQTPGTAAAMPAR